MSRAARVGTVALGVALVAAVASLMVGQVAIPADDVLKAAVGLPSDNGAAFIVGQLRAPRVYTAALVGALLAASGALLQSVVRNPLASPDLIGVTAGATVAAVAWIAATRSTSTLALAPAAMTGALVASALIAVLGWRGGIQPMRMIIGGIGVGFVAASGTTYLLATIPETLVPQAYAWTVGSTNARLWEHVRIAAIAAAVVVPLAFALQRQLRVAEMGDDLARSLGVRLGPVRAGAVALAAVSAGAAVAVVGPVGFVALVAPALARRLSGGSGIAVLPSAAIGAGLVVAADLAAREAFAPTQLPVGLLTAAIGAPYLIALVSRSRGGFA